MLLLFSTIFISIYSISGCIGETPRTSECTEDSHCPGQLACLNQQCSNPCTSLPCGANANCVPEDHAAWCRCKSGYAENSAGQCVSQCEGTFCGHNAQCIVSAAGRKLNLLLYLCYLSE